MSVRHQHTQATHMVREVHGISCFLMLCDGIGDRLSDRALELLGPFGSSVLKIVVLLCVPVLIGSHAHLPQPE
jgi:hypothetical protein